MAFYGSAEVTKKFQALLEQGVTEFESSNSFIGFDPNLGVHKFLTVVYSYHGEVYS